MTSGTATPLMMKQGIFPKVVQERLGHSSIAVTMDTYSQALPGMQEAAAQRFDEGLRGVKLRSNWLLARKSVSKMFARTDVGVRKQSYNGKSPRSDRSRGLVIARFGFGPS